MSQKNWAKYFLALGKPENVEVGWAPAGEQSGRSSPVNSIAKFEELEAGVHNGSPKSSGNIIAKSYKSAGKSRKRRAKNRKTRKQQRKSRRQPRRAN